jgi:hypothetical protein
MEEDLPHNVPKNNGNSMRIWAKEPEGFAENRGTPFVLRLALLAQDSLKVTGRVVKNAHQLEEE